MSDDLSKQRSHHIHGLDALKTLAIVGVTLFHMFPSKVPGGYLGVSFFFVLTGYLLAYTSFRDLAAHRFGVARYYWKRIKRIYPSLLLMLLVSIGVFHFVAPNVISAVRPEAISILLGYNNWWQIAQNADYFTRMANASPFTHLWFLGIELQYYLVWPLLFGFYLCLHALLGRGVAIGIFAFLGLASAAIMPMMYVPDMDVTRLYYGTDTRIHALLLGAAMGLWHASARLSPEGSSQNSGTDDRALLKGSIAVLCLAGIVSSYFLLHGQDSIVYRGGMLEVTLVFCLLLQLIITSRSKMVQKLDSPWLSWLGKHSYGIFLWQYPVIFLCVHLGLKGILLPLTEITAILLLTLWSDAVTAFVLRPHKLEICRKTVLAKALAVLLCTTIGSVFAGYGCYGLVASASQKADMQAELAARLEREAAALRENPAPKAAVPQPEQQQMQTVNLDGIACIGDSVMLGSASELQSLFPNCLVDAEVCRYVNGGADEAEQLAAQGQIGDVVVIHLGTNGPLADGERYEVHSRRLLDLMGPDCHVFWVNTYAPHLEWQDTNNAYLEKMAAERPNLKIIDWYSLASQHEDWLGEDGVHPNDEGAVQYANMIHDTVVKELSKGK